MGKKTRRKIGRNDPCPCGSGMKLKKCCIGKNKKYEGVSASGGENRVSRKIAVVASGNEPIMPVRLYYKIRNKIGLITKLTKIKCVSSYGDTYSVCYEHEAEQSAFFKRNKTSKISKKKGREETLPILAYCKIVDDDNMYIDVETHSGAIDTVEFIDACIPKEILEVTHVATYNKIFTVDGNKEEQPVPSYEQYDEIFLSEKLVEMIPERVEGEENSCADKVDKRKESIDRSETALLKPLPLVEKFPIHFYKSGIEQFEMMLGFRARVAAEHACGNEDYTMYDAVDNFVSFVARKRGWVD